MIDAALRDAEATDIVGRTAELARLRQLLDGARQGQSGVLVVRGEPGIGKSALLDAAASTAGNFLVTRIAGVESEMELPYAALQQLCRPFADDVSVLPKPLREALESAFGLGSGHPPDRFQVGLAALQLLANGAEKGPLLFVIDDAQWLDGASVQTLAFVGRRVLAEQIAVLIGTRDGTASGDFAEFPGMELHGLGDTDAATVLGSVLAGPTDPRVVERILAESRGNPLALLELPRTWTEAETVEGLAEPRSDALVERVEEQFAQRLRSLPADARLLLTLAAAEPCGDPSLLWSAADRLGLGWDAASVAEQTGYIDFGLPVRFRHPLIRAAAYRTASTRERLDVHAALAEVTDPVVDPDRRAWHRANATVTKDDEIASELDDAAERARARGGPLAAAALLERAALLTTDPAARADRTLAAATAKREAGALEAALHLLRSVDTVDASELRRAHVDRLRGQIAYDQGRADDAAQLLLDAAIQLDHVDERLARETYLEALAATIWASGHDDEGSLLKTAKAAADSTPAVDAPGVAELVLDALAERITDGYPAAAAKLTTALHAIASMDVGSVDADGLLSVASNRAAGMISMEVWDYDTGRSLAERQVRIARDAGRLGQLRFGLNHLANHLVIAGELSEAAALVEEDRLVSKILGAPALEYTSLLLAAYRGDEERTAGLIASTSEAARTAGQRRIVEWANYAAAVLHNGLGRHEQAVECARRLFAGDMVGLQTLAVSELAEAASRAGDVEMLAFARQWLAERVDPTPTEWAMGIDARVRALATQGPEAEQLFRDSVGHLAATRVRVEEARAHLLLGEWLRREGRRGDARDELRSAHELMSEMTLGAFAERARRELLASGERVRKTSPREVGLLTAQESQVARLAQQGLSNPEIATRLFLSARTVEWHLRNIFPKVGVSSRRQLRDIDLAAYLADPLD